MYKVREALREFGDVEIGTTETFQGREKRVMIISTVRAQEDLLLYDEKYKLGFVREPKVIRVPKSILPNENWFVFVEV